MYDPLETDLSFRYLDKITDIKNTVIVGGWATYFYVNENYRRAFGIDYLRSRDIDIFVKSDHLLTFIKKIEQLGFIPSSYFFRYELIYDRNSKNIITKKEAKREQIHNLVFVFLDLFTEKEAKKAWAIDIFKDAKTTTINNRKVIDIKTLLELKCYSFFEREKLDKELKDACDIYVLLIYSERKFQITESIRKVIDKIIKRRDLGEFVAENVLRDITKVSIVNASLQKL